MAAAKGTATAVVKLLGVPIISTRTVGVRAMRWSVAGGIRPFRLFLCLCVMWCGDVCVCCVLQWTVSQIYGVGWVKANNICSKLGLNPQSKVSDHTHTELMICGGDVLLIGWRLIA